MVIVLPGVLAAGVALTGIGETNESSDRKNSKEPRAGQERRAPAVNGSCKITMALLTTSTTDSRPHNVDQIARFWISVRSDLVLKNCPFLHILTFLKLQSRALSCTEQRSPFTYICHKTEIHPRLKAVCHQRENTGALASC